jgi:hypothetical protein
VHVGRPSARASDVGLDLLAVVVEHVAEDHGRALADEQPRLGGALSARAAADQRHLACESVHEASSCSSV